MSGFYPVGFAPVGFAPTYASPVPPDVPINNNWPVFPYLPGQSWPITRVPQWHTRTQVARSGKVVVMSDWVLPRYTWTLVHNVLRQGSVNGQTYTEMQQVMAFFNRCNGPFSTFLYEDWDDYSISNQLVGVGDGTTTYFTLVRTLGGFTERTFAPNLETSITVSVNNVIQSPSTYSVTPWGTSNSLGPGVLIFDGAPVGGALIRVNFDYYWPVRFVMPSCLFEKIMSGYYMVKQLSFKSVNL